MAKAKANAKDIPEWMVKLQSVLIMKHSKNLPPYPVWNAQNIRSYMKHCPDWHGVFGWNEFTLTPMLRKKIPKTHISVANFKPRPLRDSDVVDVLCWFQRNGFAAATISQLNEAMSAVFRENVFHPLQDYLNGLEWDGVERIDTWLADYLGAPETEFNRKIGAKWLISGAARALRPGCKADCALVLEGPQGGRKSGALAVLGGEWFTDNLPDMHSKDAAMSLAGMWIIEVPELAAMRRSDINGIKSFMSRVVDRFRPPYGKNTIETPRHCILAGSTNSSGYLEDETGGRRFWPVACGIIDITKLIQDRDQLWAEAVHRMKAGESWWMEREDETEAEAIRSTRMKEDAWEGPVTHWLEAEKFKEVTTVMILNGAIKKFLDKIEQRDVLRVAKILTQMGWERDGKFTSGHHKGSVKWVRPPLENDPETSPDESDPDAWK